MKKAQIEIIGLLLIVILLSVILVVFLRFALKSDTSYTPEARQSIIAKTTIDSLIKTSFNDQTFENLIYECYTGYNCNILKQEINAIMSKLMPNKQFFYVFTSNEQVFLEIGENCIGIQANNPYIINSIPIKISLKLC